MDRGREGGGETGGQCQVSGPSAGAGRSTHMVDT